MSEYSVPPSKRHTRARRVGISPRELGEQIGRAHEMLPEEQFSLDGALSRALLDMGRRRGSTQEVRAMLNGVADTIKDPQKKEEIKKLADEVTG